MPTALQFSIILIPDNLVGMIYRMKVNMLAAIRSQYLATFSIGTIENTNGKSLLGIVVHTCLSLTIPEPKLSF